VKQKVLRHIGSSINLDEVENLKKLARYTISEIEKQREKDL
jgi:hypothetical protein